MAQNRRDIYHAGFEDGVKHGRAMTLASLFDFINQEFEFKDIERAIHLAEYIGVGRKERTVANDPKEQNVKESS